MATQGAAWNFGGTPPPAGDTGIQWANISRPRIFVAIFKIIYSHFAVWILASLCRLHRNSSYTQALSLTGLTSGRSWKSVQSKKLKLKTSMKHPDWNWARPSNEENHTVGVNPHCCRRCVMANNNIVRQIDRCTHTVDLSFINLH